VNLRAESREKKTEEGRGEMFRFERLKVWHTAVEL